VIILHKALLIVDVQNDYFEGGKSELYKAQDALSNIEKVLMLFREKGLPVIHVQHISTDEGATFFLSGTQGADIHRKLVPLSTEEVIIKHSPNSFLNTNLTEVLQEYEIDELIICGMMSHMCIDTTTRACMDYGINVTLLQDACTTKDLVFCGNAFTAETVHNIFMASLNGVFADVINTEDLQV